MKKKAILFTLSIFFILIIVLNSALLNTDTAESSRLLLQDMFIFDKTHDLFSSIEESMRTLIEIKSGINVTVHPNNNTITFVDEIPNPNRPQLLSALSDFETFIESSYPSVDIDTTEFAHNGTITVYPDTINYTHVGGLGSNIIALNASSPINNTFNRTSFLITLPDTNFSSILPAAPIGDGDFEIEVIIQSKDVAIETHLYRIDLDTDHRITVVLDDAPVHKGLQIYNNGSQKISIENLDESDTFTSALTVTLTNSSMMDREIGLAAETIIVRNTNVNHKKKGYIRLQ